MHRLEPIGWSVGAEGGLATRDVQSSASSSEWSSLIRSGPMPLDVIMSWPDEQEFRYRASL